MHIPTASPLLSTDGSRRGVPCDDHCSFDTSAEGSAAPSHKEGNVSMVTVPESSKREGILHFVTQQV